jgi:hypothetical protein
MEVQKDISSRLRELKNDIQAIDNELKQTTEVDAKALREFRQSLDDLRMTAWRINELINARSTAKDQKVALSFLAAERLRRFGQITRELSNDIDGNHFTWESSGLQSVSDSVSLLQASLGKLVGAHRASFSASSNPAKEH